MRQGNPNLTVRWLIPLYSQSSALSATTSPPARVQHLASKPTPHISREHSCLVGLTPIAAYPFLNHNSSYMHQYLRSPRAVTHYELAGEQSVGARKSVSLGCNPRSHQYSGIVHQANLLIGGKALPQVAILQISLPFLRHGEVHYLQLC